MSIMANARLALLNGAPIVLACCNIVQGTPQSSEVLLHTTRSANADNQITSIFRNIWVRPAIRNNLMAKVMCCALSEPDGLAILFCAK